MEITQEGRNPAVPDFKKPGLFRVKVVRNGNIEMETMTVTKVSTSVLAMYFQVL